MALVLLQDLLPYKDRTKIAVDDASQDYVDGDDGGWGVAPNPNRADRCLVFFGKYIDSESSESYVTQQASVQNTDKTVAYADGDGLINTDKSRFIVDYTKDGHYIFYMIPVLRYATEPGGVEGDLYFNTANTTVFYHDGNGFIALDTANLPDIETYTDISIREQLFDLNKRYCLSGKTRKLLYDPPTEHQNIQKDIRELRNKDLLWWSAFKEGLQPTARQLLKSVEDVCQ